MPLDGNNEERQIRGEFAFAASGQGAAQQSTPSPDGVVFRVHHTPQDLIRIAGQQGMSILMGDTHHSDISLLYFMAQPDTVKAIAESGARHVFLERPTMLQNEADELITGNRSRSEFVDNMYGMNPLHHVLGHEAREIHGMTADLILRAQPYGLQTHFIDKLEAVNDASHPLNKVLDDAFEAWREERGMTVSQASEHLKTADGKEEYAPFLKDYVFSRYSKEELEKITKDFFEKRFDDTALAGRIEAAAGGEQFISFYGYQHGAGSNDLNEKLSGPTVTIAAYATRERYLEHMRDMPPKDKPDFIYIQEEGSVYATYDANPDVLRQLDVTPSAGPTAEPLSTPATAAPPAPAHYEQRHHP